MIRFLAEIFERLDAELHFSLFNENSDITGFKIYEMDIRPRNTEEPNNKFAGMQIEPFIGRFLTRVWDIEDLKEKPYSMFLTDAQKNLVNIPENLWLESGIKTEVNRVWSFLSNSLNSKEPSNNVLLNVRVPIKLDIPSASLTSKLSDNISGVTLNQSFSVSLHNDDGYFDDEVRWNLFNAPVHLKKAVVENPEYKNFKTIRSGLVENTTITFDSLRIDVAEKIRAMDNPVCDVICAKNFSKIDIKRNLNKNIPIVYGEKKIELLELNKDKRIYLLAEGLTKVVRLYNGEDPVPPGVIYDIDYGRYTIKINTPNVEITHADVVGYEDNKIGSIIKHLVTEKAGVDFNSTNWDEKEFDRYNNTSAEINIVIERGTVRNAIQEILKNDMAYFIQKLDGRFTMRKYGERYAVHKLPSWTITKKPEKTWASAQENYFSSCVINYDFEDSNTYKSFYFTSRESEAIAFYRRDVRRTFNTNLTTSLEAQKLATLLASRYIKMKQTLRLPVGVDTSGFELLDTISIDVNINGRRFSKAKRFVIKEINPAQDILVLEETDDIYLVTHERKNIITSRNGGKRMII